MSMSLLTDALHTLRRKIDGPLGRRLPLRTLLSGILLLFSLRLILVKRRTTGRRSKYVSNLESVGKKVVDGKALNLEDAPEYDIVIIGGGTAGCVLAARLSENPNIRVLLLESGGSGQANPCVRMPSGFSRLFSNGRLVHSFYTEEQSSANGARKFWPRARMLGGCSSINAQSAQYGASGDFDEWAAIIGDESWAWKNLSRYFRKFESFQPHPDYPSVDANFRGKTGPVQVGFFNTVSVWCDHFIRACLSVGIPANPDFDGAELNPIGVGRLMTYVSQRHERVSSESAYLTPAVLNRSNLTVVIRATVTRVLIDTTDDKPRAVGAEFVGHDNGPRYQARAKKEVVTCAGAVQSPAILMMSGIGPASHLKEKGIPVVCDLPGVGTNLFDHTVVATNFKQNGVVNSLSFFNPANIPDTFKFLRSLLQYYVFQTGGPIAMTFCEAAAFVRTDDPKLFPPEEYPETLVDSTSATTSPDLECFVVPIATKDHGRMFYDVDTFAISVYLLRPTSQGYIRLKSINPFDHPIINPNYLQTREDVAKLVRGVRLGLKIAQQEPINSLIDRATPREEFDHKLHLKSDSELEEVVRKRVETIYHPTSTCKMAKREDGGVVDARLRVYGVEGLRVCDASIFPNIVSGHTAGACLAVGEKLADLIQSDSKA